MFDFSSRNVFPAQCEEEYCHYACMFSISRARAICVNDMGFCHMRSTANMVCFIHGRYSSGGPPDAEVIGVDTTTPSTTSTSTQSTTTTTVIRFIEKHNFVYFKRI